MCGSKLKALLCAVVLLLGARGLFVAEAVARTRGRDVIRLPGGSLAVGSPRITNTRVTGTGFAEIDVTFDNAGSVPLAVSSSDFALVADGDMFGVRRWDAGRGRLTIAPRHSRVIRLTFVAPTDAVEQGTLYYRSAARNASAVPLLAHRATRAAAAVTTFYLSGGVGEPWGTAIDGAGNVWFAEPGCDFAPTCSSSTPPGQIGELQASTHALAFYELPNIIGNQPIFLTFDGSGKLWFTTPNNDMIGEFDPASGTFVGQWPVTSGTGPWDLAFGGGTLWYTEHLASAIGSFDPASHSHQDFQTPSANSAPYGIAAQAGSIWFTENNSNVDQIGVLNTKNNVISEYPIVRPQSGTPHLLAVDPNGDPWWSEGWSGTIATLDPSVATPGSCGTTSGTCSGVRRFALPSSTSCSSATHVSGIAYQSSSSLVWLDDSLTAQLGSFNPSTSAFALTTISDCPHTHDGLNLDASGNVWFDEEFSNALGALIP